MDPAAGISQLLRHLRAGPAHAPVVDARRHPESSCHRLRRRHENAPPRPARSFPSGPDEAPPDGPLSAPVPWLPRLRGLRDGVDEASEVQGEAQARLRQAAVAPRLRTLNLESVSEGCARDPSLAAAARAFRRFPPQVPVRQPRGESSPSPGQPAAWRSRSRHHDPGQPSAKRPLGAVVDRSTSDNSSRVGRFRSLLMSRSPDTTAAPTADQDMSP